MTRSKKATTRTGSVTLDRVLKIAENLLNEAEQAEEAISRGEISDGALDVFYAELKRQAQEHLCECDRETIRAAIQVASDTANPPDNEMMLVDRTQFVEGLDKLTDELWSASEEYEQTSRFEILSAVVADFLRGLRDVDELYRVLEDCDAEVPPR